MRILWVWALFFPNPAGAIVYTWTNAGGAADWTNTANWDQVSGFPDGPGDVAVFTNLLATNLLVYLHSNISLGGMYFGSPNDMPIVFMPGSNGRIHLTNTGGAVSFIKPPSSTAEDIFSNELVLSADLYVTNQGNGLLRFRGSLLENRSSKFHIFASSGTVALHASNTFSGGFIQEGGTVLVGFSNHGSPGSVVAGPCGTGIFTFLAGKLRAISGSSIDSVLLNPFVLAGDLVAPGVTNGEKTLILKGDLTLSNGTRELSVSIGSNFPETSLSILGSIHGDGLRVSGTGRLILAGDNDFSNGLYIAPGAQVIVSNTNGLGLGGVTNDGMLFLSMTNNMGQTVTPTGLSSSFFGTGTNIVLPCALSLGSATVAILGSGAGFQGVWFIGPGAPSNAGKVRFTTNSHPTAEIHVFTNSTLYCQGGVHSAKVLLYGGYTGETYGQIRVEGNAVVTGPVVIAGPMWGSNRGHLGQLVSSTGTIAGPLQITNGLWSVSKSGGGTLILSNTNSFSTSLVIMAGTVRAGISGWTNGGPFGSNATLVLSNASNVFLELNGLSNHVGALVGGGPVGGEVRLGGGVLAVGHNDGGFATNGAFAGLLTGSGTLWKFGSNNLHLQNTNTFVGPTWLDGGFLQVGPGSCLGAGPVLITNQAIRLVLTNGTVLTNTISVKGGLSASGRGVVEQSFAGAGALSNSTLWLSNGMAAGGLFSSANGGYLDLYSTIYSVGSTLSARSGNVRFGGGGGSYGNISIGDGVSGLLCHNGLLTNTVISIGTASHGSIQTTWFDPAGFDQSLLRFDEDGGSNNSPNCGNSSTTRDSTLTVLGGGTNNVSIWDQMNGGTRKIHLIYAAGTNLASGSNRYSGSTTVQRATLRAGIPWSPGQYGAFGSNAPMVLSNDVRARLDLNGFDNDVGSLTGGGGAGGNVVLGSATLFVGGDGTSPAPYAGVISGSGALVKVGTGFQILSGTNTFSGGTFISAGTLAVDGRLSDAAVVRVSNGGTLSGSGAVGLVTVLSNGTLAPGYGTNFNTLAVSNLVFSAGSIFSLKLSGTGPTLDGVRAGESVACGGSLVISQVTNGASNQTYSLVSAPMVTGIFDGLPDGALFSQQGRTFRITYATTNVLLRDVGGAMLIPMIAVTNPVPGLTHSGIVMISGIATNNDTNSAQPTVWFGTNGGALSNFATGPAWTFPLNTSNYPDGTNQFVFMTLATNGFSNHADWTMVVDNTPPALPTVTMSTDTFVEPIGITLTATDPWGIRAIYATLDGSTPTTNGTPLANGGTMVLSNTATLSAMAVDMAGNASGVVTRTFTRIANDPGTGSVQSVAPNPWNPAYGPMTVVVFRKNMDPMTLVVVDMAGRQLVELSPIGGSGRYALTFQWDGKIPGGRTAGRGLYRLLPKVQGSLQIDGGRRLYIP